MMMIEKLVATQEGLVLWNYLPKRLSKFIQAP